MGKVLVLNASYEPLNITSWRRAVVLLLKGKAEQVEHNGKVLYTGLPLPTVPNKVQSGATRRPLPAECCFADRSA